ncbi:hypothetical protein CW714_07655 [Methanophagales archaeon]|nr:MAG: hypothetical protein CW714_07655 [Methanophagales archaeon]
MARGRRIGFGRGFWSGFGPGRGMGMGNPYPFCRNFPWLPRWWWTGMHGPIAPAPGIYPVPYYGYSYPYSYGRWIR